MLKNKDMLQVLAFSFFTNLLPSSALELRLNSEPIPVLFRVRLLLTAAKQCPGCSAQELLWQGWQQKHALKAKAISASFIMQSSLTFKNQQPRWLSQERVVMVRMGTPDSGQAEAPHAAQMGGEGREGGGRQLL